MNNPSKKYATLLGKSFLEERGKNNSFEKKNT